MSQLGTKKALGYEQITGMTTAKGLNPPKGATRALIRVEAQGVRWRDDGTAPTATVGMPLSATESMNYDAYSQPTQALFPVQFIATTAGAILNVSYYE